MLNLGSKTSSSSQIFTIPSNFRNQAEALKQGHFLDLHVIVFIKYYWITISVTIILSINRWGLYHFKKCRMDNQIYISQLSASLLFYKLLFEVKKIDVRLNNTLKLKFILVFFDSVYPTRPSDTVTKYTVYLPILLVERLLRLSWVLFCYFILWLEKPASKMPCILLFEIEYLFESVSTNPPFLSRPSYTKVQTAIIWW